MGGLNVESLDVSVGVSPNTPEQAAAVVRLVDSRALDDGDRRELLDALGLLAERETKRRPKTSPPATTTADCPINTTTGD